MLLYRTIFSITASEISIRKACFHPEQVWHCLLGREKPQTASGCNKLDRVTAQFTTGRRRRGNFRKLALSTDKFKLNLILRR
jgi:hypothetical protein